METEKTNNLKSNIIDTPERLRALPVEELPRVCHNIRQYIIDNLSSNPGHFASSMGAVEIAVALHYTLNTPEDKIVWDVGHQAYAHKILTGRYDKFDTLRKLGGLSGFPSPRESEYDTFTAGHASNSISAALGYAIANMSDPATASRRTVAVIGDASISGGLAFEGLNNASQSRNNLLIVLNDNDMSIDNNVGALHRYLSRINTSKSYNDLRHRAYKRFKRLGWVTERGRGMVLRFNNSIKALVSGNQNIFEGLNIRYFGPFDGHDIEGLVKVLNEIKDMEGPRILHLKTVKGKGFAAAEKDPSIWHAPGKFDPCTGKRNNVVRQSGSSSREYLWQDIAGMELTRMAKNDQRIIGITAGMPSGTSMSMMMEAYPDRTFDVGISEGHALTFAGGLAAAGKRPFVAIYSSFLQRAYDNIIHDVAIQHLPVTILIDRAGIVGEDGVTHHGLFDMAYLRVIPGLVIASPLTQYDLRCLMHTAITIDGPMAIRYPRGKGSQPQWDTDATTLQPGKGRILLDDPDADTAILTIGPAGLDAVAAVEQAKKEHGRRAAVYDMLWLKPLDTKLIDTVCKRHKRIITIEDGARTGGLGSAIAEYIAAKGWAIPVTRLGAPDQWVHHGSVPQLKHICGYDTSAIVDVLLQS